eukprot:12920194-Prorocentrum_lima.AAC.1
MGASFGIYGYDSSSGVATARAFHGGIHMNWRGNGCSGVDNIQPGKGLQRRSRRRPSEER